MVSRKVMTSRRDGHEHALAAVCLCILIGVLVAGLWPFNPFPGMMWPGWQIRMACTSVPRGLCSAPLTSPELVHRARPPVQLKSGCSQTKIRTATTFSRFTVRMRHRDSACFNGAVPRSCSTEISVLNIEKLTSITPYSPARPCW